MAITGKKTILSFDCAVRTLGYVYATVDFDYVKDLIEFSNNITPQSIMEFSKRKHIDLHLMSVKDILTDNPNPNIKISDVPPVQRIQKLHAFLKSLPLPDYIILEIQMNVNSPACTVSSGIVMFYLNHITYDKIIISSATKKNQVCMHHTLSFAKIKERFPTVTDKAKSKYIRHKRIKFHAVENTKYFCKLHNVTLLDKIVKDKLEHPCDAFMHLAAFSYSMCDNLT